MSNYYNTTPFKKKSSKKRVQTEFSAPRSIARKQKKGISHKKSLDAHTEAVQLGADNQAFGVSKAARIRRAARRTGHSRVDVAVTEHEFKGLKKKRKKKKK